ncbi:MAG: HAMP domain-containing protein [Clostridiales bacterium]|nr:HAMP domain-containing protein [Clostridiales bacterium]
MPKWHSYITRFLLLAAASVLSISVLLFFLSSYLFSSISNNAIHASLTSTLETGESLLADYARGKIDLSLLRERVNPAFNSGGEFVLLMDPQGRVITYTDSAVPYLAGDEAEALLRSVQESDQVQMATIRHRGGSAMLAVQRTDYGYVLGGTTLLSTVSSNASFQQRLLLWMCCSVLLILIISSIATKRMGRPTRILADAAAKLISGEDVQLPDTLHGELSEIARGFNHMSRTVARAFQELRHEKETMQQVLEALNEGIYAVDENGQVLHRNTAALRLLGGEETLAAKEVLACLQRMIAAQADSDMPPMATCQVEQGGRLLEYIVTPLPDQPGTPRGASALIRDITEQERLERTRHDYVANISHELRTPLASMRGLAEGMRDGLVTDPQEQLRYLNIIVNEVTRLSRLVNDLLELSGLQSNPVAFEMEKIDPGQVVWELHDLNLSLFEEKQLHFTFSLPEEELPPVRSNEDRINQVLTIFLDNARKYTPEGGHVVLGAERHPDGVRFYVKDDGIGMDEETCLHAFDRFHQAEKSHSGKGSGLGLAIAKEVMSKLGVEIFLQSAPGRGSEFSFVLPLCA